jgi:hypothetical protein
MNAACCLAPPRSDEFDDDLTDSVRGPRPQRSRKSFHFGSSKSRFSFKRSADAILEAVSTENSTVLDEIPPVPRFSPRSANSDDFGQPLRTTAQRGSKASNLLRKISGDTAKDRKISRLKARLSVSSEADVERRKELKRELLRRLKEENEEPFANEDMAASLFDSDAPVVWKGLTHEVDHEVSGKAVKNAEAPEATSGIGKYALIDQGCIEEDGHDTPGRTEECPGSDTTEAMVARGSPLASKSRRSFAKSDCSSKNLFMPSKECRSGSSTTAVLKGDSPRSSDGSYEDLNNPFSILSGGNAEKASRGKAWNSNFSVDSQLSPSKASSSLMRDRKTARAIILDEMNVDLGHDRPNQLHDRLMSLSGSGEQPSIPPQPIIKPMRLISISTTTSPNRWSLASRSSIGQSGQAESPTRGSDAMPREDLLRRLINNSDDVFYLPNAAIAQLENFSEDLGQVEGSTLKATEGIPSDSHQLNTMPNRESLSSNRESNAGLTARLQDMQIPQRLGSIARIPMSLQPYTHRRNKSSVTTSSINCARGRERHSRKNSSSRFASSSVPPHWGRVVKDSTSSHYTSPSSSIPCSSSQTPGESQNALAENGSSNDNRTVNDSKFADRVTNVESALILSEQFVGGSDHRRESTAASGFTDASKWSDMAVCIEDELRTLKFSADYRKRTRAPSASLAKPRTSRFIEHFEDVAQISKPISKERDDDHDRCDQAIESKRADTEKRKLSLNQEDTFVSTHKTGCVGETSNLWGKALENLGEATSEPKKRGSSMGGWAHPFRKTSYVSHHHPHIPLLDAATGVYVQKHPGLSGAIGPVAEIHIADNDSPKVSSERATTHTASVGPKLSKRSDTGIWGKFPSFNRPSRNTNVNSDDAVSVNDFAGKPEDDNTKSTKKLVKAFNFGIAMKGIGKSNRRTSVVARNRGSIVSGLFGNSQPQHPELEIPHLGVHFESSLDATRDFDIYEDGSSNGVLLKSSLNELPAADEYSLTNTYARDWSELYEECVQKQPLIWDDESYRESVSLESSTNKPDTLSPVTGNEKLHNPTVASSVYTNMLSHQSSLYKGVLNDYYPKSGNTSHLGLGLRKSTQDLNVAMKVSEAMERQNVLDAAKKAWGGCDGVDEDKENGNIPKEWKLGTLDTSGEPQKVNNEADGSYANIV